MHSKYTLFFITLLFCKHPAFTQVVQPTIVMFEPSQYTNMAVINSMQLAPLPMPNKGFLADKGTGCICRVGCTPLPVTLLSFEGKRLAIEDVLLKWKTTNEVQNKGFNVERSLGTPDRFEYISFIPAQVNYLAEKKYDLHDYNDFSGNSYYRLKQVDVDGRFIYSKTLLIKGYPRNKSLALYPNPAKDNLVASINFERNGTAKLLLLDAAQKTILVKYISIYKGVNLIPIPIGSFAGGLYFIQIFCNDKEVLIGKFIKQQ